MERLKDIYLNYIEIHARLISEKIARDGMLDGDKPFGDIIYELAILTRNLGEFIEEEKHARTM